MSTALGCTALFNDERIIGEESVKKGTNTLTARQIDQIIKATRAEKKKH
ncbi:MAG TPA: hypothetical protein VMU26_31115 [Candidatus Polarisedimenticolia bacterium]|nr:hypothetical protein [Candidatus Polarisedimenticolia bacterium]